MGVGWVRSFGEGGEAGKGSSEREKKILPREGGEEGAPSPAVQKIRAMPSWRGKREGRESKVLSVSGGEENEAEQAEAKRI